MCKKRSRIDRSRFISLDSKPVWNTRGQVTIFIILGIVLLIVIALVILIQQEIVTFKPQEVEVTEKGKIEQFIASCISSVGEEAVFRVGLQGGYITVPEEISRDGNLNLRTSPITVIPYWAYGDTPSIPSLEQIQTEINLYIEENLRPCLFALEPFQETYVITEKSSITATTEAAQNRILFTVHWDLEIRNKAGEMVTELVDHTAESPIRLKEAYDTARTIVETELRDLKFEDITQDLIALEHPNVPVAGLEFTCTEKKWKIADVQQTLQNLLHINIPEIRLAGTETIAFPEGLPYYENHYLWNAGEEFSASQISVQFNYETSYPFTFDVAPRSGLFIKSNQLGGGDVVSFPCVQTWKFIYDLSYPVVVTVRDETTGYNFKIAFTVHLQNNIPDRSGVYTANRPTAANTFSDEEFCRERTIPFTVSTSELVENEQTGVSNRQSLDGVDLTFTCLRYSCPIGTTEYNYALHGDTAFLTTNFPYCAGGIVRASKENYKDGWQRVVTTTGQQVDLDLVPLFSVPLTKIYVLKHELNTQQQLTLGKELSPQETVLVKLTYRKNDLPLNQPFHEDTTVYSPSLDPAVLEQEKLDLLAKADFTYILEVSVLNDEQFVGGYKGNWTVPWEELAGANEITFHIISKDSASNEEQFALLADIESQSKLLPQPEIN